VKNLHVIMEYLSRMYLSECSLAMPSQSKVLTGGGDVREAQFDVLLSAVPAYDRIAGLFNRHLNSNRGICLC
jgi:hypothetical protein